MDLGRATRKIAELAKGNERFFRSSPVARLSALVALSRYRYAGDRETCGRPDCWSTAEELLAARAGDCEDWAAFIAGALAACGFDAAVGVQRGRSIHHAVARWAFGRLDPSEWQGMRPKVEPTNQMNWESL